MPYQSTTDRGSVASRLKNTAGPIWLFTHAKPDGDALGSLLSLYLTLKQMGKTVTGVLSPPVPGYASVLSGWDQLLVDDGASILERALEGEPELVVVCDTGAVKQLGSAERLIKPYLDRTLIIDHHLSGDLAAESFLIDAAQASCAEIIADIIDLLAVEKGADTLAVNTALYTGLATDTGWFRFSNTTPNTMRRAASLIEKGVNHADLYERIEQQQPPEKLALMARVLGSLRIVAGGKAAVMGLSVADFAETGAAVEHTEGLVNLPLMVGQIQAAALVTEKMGDDGGIASRISFRSKPQQDPVAALDVSALAGIFGGGGHARAAGGGFDGALAGALAAVAKAFDEAL